MEEFKTKKELFEHLVKNRDTLIAQKKAAIKYADSVSYSFYGVEGVEIKAEGETSELKRKAIINTSNILDSHDDVHIPGLWSKSLKENKFHMYLQEHEMKFSKVIADGKDVSASAKYYDWKELGYNFEGKTQALEFDVTINKSRNPYMFDQFKQNRVRNNSVGMQYVKIALAVNDEDYDSEFEAWNKYLPAIANKEDAESNGYFWAVTEAKIVEGSAVLRGSNQFTPILESKEEPAKVTQLDINEVRSLIKNCLK